MDWEQIVTVKRTEETRVIRVMSTLTVTEMIEVLAAALQDKPTQTITTTQLHKKIISKYGSMINKTCAGSVVRSSVIIL